jgi:hypothetical protein
MKRIRNNPRAIISVVTLTSLSLSWCVLTANPSAAETLENIIESKAMQDFKQTGTVHFGKDKKAAALNQWLRGIDQNSNFSTIWTSSNAPQVLLNWVGAKLPYMRYKRPRSARSRDFVSAEVELSTSQRELSHLLIMVPHPSISPLVEANVLEEFRRLRPPLLEVLSEKPIPLTGAHGTLYEHKNGGGSLVIPVSQNGLINITIADFKKSQMLIDIAKGLDIERLNRKLDS